MWKLFITPILTYGLEIFDLKRTAIEGLERFQAAKLKQILSLPNNTAIEVVYVLLGIPPVEVFLHKKVLGMFGNICRTPGSIEWRIAERQLAVKGILSLSWVSMVRRLLAIYNLQSAYDLFTYPPKKSAWKNTVTKTINRQWEWPCCLALGSYPPRSSESVYST